jgi:hypothetical protein
MKITKIAICMALLTSASAHAAEVDEPAPDDQAVDASYSTFLNGPTRAGRGAVTIAGGWDAAAQGARADASGWIPVYGRVSLVLGAHLGESETWRPSAGVAVALWRPASGQAGSLGQLLVQYKAEGFSEPEGELELTLRSGYRWKRASLLAEGSYGQDGEAAERDAELAADASLAFGRISLGVGARGRDGLGEKQERVAWDLAFGPHLGVVVARGHFIAVTGGWSLMAVDGATRSGVVGMASYGVAY